MGTEQHTKGPWRVEHMAESGHYEIVANGQILAEVYYDELGPFGRAAHDAALFAAAPLMLAALEAVSLSAVTLPPEAGLDGQHVETPAILQVRAAIALATL